MAEKNSRQLLWNTEKDVLQTYEVQPWTHLGLEPTVRRGQGRCPLPFAPLGSEQAGLYINQGFNTAKSYISLNNDGILRAPRKLFLLLG